MGFLTGFGCAFRGMGRLASSPGLWPYSLAPVAVTAVLLAGLLWLYQSHAVEPLAAWARDLTGGSAWAGWTATIGTWLVAAVAVYFAFTAFVRVVAAPFLALLADRTVAHLTGAPAPCGPGGRLVRWIVRPVSEALLVLAIRLTITVLALPLLLVPLVGAFLFTAVTMGLLGLDLLDIAQSARGVLVKDRLRFAFGHPGACLGLGVAAGLLLLVPCVNVFLVAPAVVGAVLLDRAISPDFPRSAPPGAVS